MITKKQFNEKYYIEATVTSYQKAKLAEDDTYGEIEYGSLEEVLETTGYVVMDSDTHDTAFEYEGGSEDGFIEELKRRFSIVD